MTLKTPQETAGFFRFGWVWKTGATHGAASFQFLQGSYAFSDRAIQFVHGGSTELSIVSAKGGAYIHPCKQQKQNKEPRQLGLDEKET